MTAAMPCGCVLKTGGGHVETRRAGGGADVSGVPARAIEWVLAHRWPDGSMTFGARASLTHVAIVAHVASANDGGDSACRAVHPADALVLAVADEHGAGGVERNVVRAAELSLQRVRRVSEAYDKKRRDGAGCGVATVDTPRRV